MFAFIFAFHSCFVLLCSAVSSCGCLLLFLFSILHFFLVGDLHSCFAVLFSSSGFLLSPLLSRLYTASMCFASCAFARAFVFISNRSPPF
eukprot:m.55984 g.55984  ORF g.55984 m.55984 type:complete len:90 (-) comp12003_c0_seq3:24-293(-)